jgi:hypothetical protein
MDIKRACSVTALAERFDPTIKIQQRIHISKKRRPDESFGTQRVDPAHYWVAPERWACVTARRRRSG